MPKIQRDKEKYLTLSLRNIFTKNLHVILLFRIFVMLNNFTNQIKYNMDNLVLRQEQRDVILSSYYSRYLDMTLKAKERKAVAIEYTKRFPNLPKLGSYELNLLLFNETQIKFIEICLMEKMPLQIYKEHRTSLYAYPCLKLQVNWKEGDPILPNCCTSENSPEFPMELKWTIVDQFVIYYCK